MIMGSCFLEVLRCCVPGPPIPADPRRPGIISPDESGREIPKLRPLQAPLLEQRIGGRGIHWGVSFG
jgi:hypothetical protein